MDSYRGSLREVFAYRNYLRDCELQLDLKAIELRAENDLDSPASVVPLDFNGLAAYLDDNHFFP